MSWVLILSPSAHVTMKHPAIIGGYYTKESAIEAGRIACILDENDCIDETNNRHWYRSWDSYTVIPGSASTPPDIAL